MSEILSIEDARHILLERASSGDSVLCEVCGRTLSRLDSFEYVQSASLDDRFYCTKCIKKLKKEY